MCIVIDICALASVFKKDSQKHPDYKPVYEYIYNGNGCVVYGGKKYKSELAKAERYLNVIRQLSTAGKAIAISDAKVNKLERDIIKKTKSTNCDDQHIIALLDASCCSLLCSCDSRSFEHVKNRALYTSNLKVRIYTSFRNKDLITKRKQLSPSDIKNKA